SVCRLVPLIRMNYHSGYPASQDVRSAYASYSSSSLTQADYALPPAHPPYHYSQPPQPTQYVHPQHQYHPSQLNSYPTPTHNDRTLHVPVQPAVAQSYQYVAHQTQYVSHTQPTYHQYQPPAVSLPSLVPYYNNANSSYSNSNIFPSQSSIPPPVSPCPQYNRSQFPQDPYSGLSMPPPPAPTASLDCSYHEMSRSIPSKSVTELHRHPIDPNSIMSPSKKYDIAVKTLFKNPIEKVQLKYLKKTMGSSDDSSPERKTLGSNVSSLPPHSSSSSSFSLTAATFIPRSGSILSVPPLKPNLNPHAPAFVPSQSTTEDRPPLIDSKGETVDEEWMDAHEKELEKNKEEIDELRRKVEELQFANKRMEDERIKKENQERSMAKDNKDRINTIHRMENDMKAMTEAMEWKDQKISDIAAQSKEKAQQLSDMASKLNVQLEEMKKKCREANLCAIEEKREKDRLREAGEHGNEERRKHKLHVKTVCAKNGVVLCTDIINRLSMDPEASVMVQIFMDLRKKWSNLHKILSINLDALNMGEPIDWESVLSLEEPSMPRETDQLVEECYVYHYQTMHILSFRLAFIVKRCLKEYKRTYLDAYVIGIIQKWMRIHKDPTKIEAKVPQVANMVAQAMGDLPLFPPKYVSVCVSRPSVPSVPSVSAPSGTSSRRVDHTASVRTMGGSVNESAKGWKKPSDKMRQVELHEHECTICLEPTVEGDISYCEHVSCNEPYHNNCLAIYWNKGGRNCPRCRTPMPPRDAYPALA
ncbi:hypothetical protein PFISCL1PPCAC_19652, partial [Pristionchus fissidentatus]